MKDFRTPFLVVALPLLVAACDGGADDRAGSSFPDTSSPAGSVEIGDPSASTSAISGGPVPADGPMAEPGPEASSPTPAVVPPGGIERWVADLRLALEPVELNPRESYDEVLRLYLTYQRNIARYYGRGGEFTGNEYPELAASVDDLEAAFQDLLELTELTVRLRVERSELLDAIHGVKTELSRTLARAREAGVPLDRPDFD